MFLLLSGLFLDWNVVPPSDLIVDDPSLASPLLTSDAENVPHYNMTVYLIASQ